MDSVVGEVMKEIEEPMVSQKKKRPVEYGGTTVGATKKPRQAQPPPRAKPLQPQVYKKEC